MNKFFVKTEQLSAASYSMFYTLKARALATQFYPELDFSDEFAVEIQKMNIANIPIYKTDKDFITSVTTRSKIIDRVVVNYLQKNPNATFVSLGCGLCSRGHRLSYLLKNVEYQWINIDLEHVIEIRNDLYPEQSGIINKSYSDIESACWLDEIQNPENYSVFIIMEGVSPYLQQDKLEQLILNIAQKYKLKGIIGKMLFDYCHPNYNYDDTLVNRRSNKKIKFRAGFRNANEVQSIAANIAIDGEHNDISEFSREYALAEKNFKTKNNQEEPYNIIELAFDNEISSGSSITNMHFFDKIIYWNKKFTRQLLSNKQYLFLAEDNHFIITEREYNTVVSFLLNDNETVGSFQDDLYAVYLINQLKEAQLLIDDQSNNYYTTSFSKREEELIFFDNHELIFLSEIQEKEFLIEFVQEVSFITPTTIVFTDDYLDPRLEEINIQHVQAQKKWMLIRLVGNQIMLGPFFDPSTKHTPCYKCLSKLLWKNQPIRKWGNQNSLTPISVPTVFSINDLQKNRSLIIEQVKKIAAKGIHSELITIDQKTAVVQSHPVNHNTHCIACENPDKSNNLNSSSIVLKSCTKTRAKDGGFRTMAPEESIKKLQNIISPLTGIIHSLECITTNQNELNIYTTSFSRFPQKEGFTTDEDFIQYSLGKGISDDQSKMSALSESIERHNAIYDGTEECLHCLADQLDAETIKPDQLKMYSQKQFKYFRQYPDSRQAVQEIPENITLHWTPIYSLLTGQKAYVPFTFCFSNTPFKDEAFIRFNSNGCAAGNTLEEAILQGFLELIERDAVAIWWYNRVNRPSICFNKLDATHLNKIKNTLDKDWDYWVLDLTHDFNIPVVAAVGRNKLSNEFRLGFGAHLDISLACTRALTELYQVIVINNQHQTAFKFSQIADHPFLKPRINSTKKEFADFNTVNYSNLKKDIDYCISLAQKLGFDVLVCNTTRSTTPLHTVKVIIPGLSFIWPEFSNQRLYNLPVKLAWQANKLTENELNSLKLFL